MDNLKMKTTDKAEENFRKLSELFPNAVTETKDGNGKVVRAIDKDILMQEISAEVVEGKQERYQFTWPDKRKSVVLSNQPTNKTLRLDRDKSVSRNGTGGGIDSENIYIEGDNLDALKILLETYLRAIDVIYIDPPYNTGRNLIYKNDFAMSAEDYSKSSGQYDGQGNMLVQNTESNGRFHTDWLNMIYPRLKIAKQLLSEEGIIILTIDDCEIQTITMMMNELFGEDNHLATIVIKNNPSGRSTVKGASIAHEYALFYGANSEVKLGRLSRNEQQISRYKEFDEKGPYEWVNFRARYSTESPKMAYPIFIMKDGSDFRIPNCEYDSEKKIFKLFEQPHNEEFISYPIDDSGKKRAWKWSIETLNEAKSTETAVRKNRNGEFAIYVKSRMNQEGMLPLTIWDNTKYSSTEYGTNYLTGLMGKRYFDYPKSIYAVTDSLRVGNATKKDAIILDFFSGSATTAHAVMQLNAEDGGHRKFIMVQLPEKCQERTEAYNAGYKNICEIGEERIRRAGKKIKEENPLTTADLDVGFRVFKVDSSNMKDVYYTPKDYNQETMDLFVDNVKEDRTSEDLLIQVMLELGVPLSSKIEENMIDGKEVFSVADGYLLACFDDDVTEKTVTEIAKKHPFYAVFRESGMKEDSVKTNYEQIFQTYSSNTIRKVL